MLALGKAVPAHHIVLLDLGRDHAEARLAMRQPIKHATLRVPWVVEFHGAPSIDHAAVRTRPLALERPDDDPFGFPSRSVAEHFKTIPVPLPLLLQPSFTIQYIGCCHAIPKIDMTGRLKELHCPALVIVGEEDPGTPVEMARDIQAALPGAQLAILRSASHLSNVEQPEELTRVLTGFLDKASGKSAR
jgi:pimeloyl-ACP methyl ester carboxylesterase